MNDKKTYVYRVRDKKTGKFISGDRSRNFWVHEGNARNAALSKEGTEVVKFELVEVSRPWK